MKTHFKRTLIILLTMALLFATGMSVCAEETANPVESLKFSACVGYTRVSGAKPPCAGDLEIPAYHNGLPVEMINSSALSYTDITSVIIPNTVNSLASGYNFDGCRKMKSVVMSDNVTVIPRSAFANCDVLESVDLGTGVTKIYVDAFINCPKLEYIELPSGITEIRSGAFFNGAFLGGDGLQCAYFPGSAAQWEQVKVEDRTLKEHILYVTHVKDVASDVNGIRVTADERPGAKQYTFYRQEQVNGTWTELSAVKTTETAVYIDQTAVSGHTYRYAVTAANGPYTTRMSSTSTELTYVPVTTTTTTTTTTAKPTTTTTTTKLTTTTTTTTRATTTTTRATTTAKPTTTTTTAATTRKTIGTKPTTTTTVATRTTTSTDLTTTTTETFTPDTTVLADPTVTETVPSDTTTISEVTTTTTTSTPDTTSTAPVATQPEQAPTNSWLFLVIGVLAGAAVGAIVVVIMKKKK